MELLTANNETYLVAPGIGLMVWTLIGLTLLAFGIVAGIKGRWIWLLVGLIFPPAMLAWPILAFQPPRPGSAWTRLAKRRRAARMSA